MRFALLATLAASRLASTDAAVSQKRLQARAVDEGAKVQRVDESTDLGDSMSLGSSDWMSDSMRDWMSDWKSEYLPDSMSDGSDESTDLGDFIDSLSVGMSVGPAEDVGAFTSLLEAFSPPDSVCLVSGTTDDTPPALGSTSSEPDPRREQEQQPLRTSGQGVPSGQGVR